MVRCLISPKGVQFNCPINFPKFVNIMNYLTQKIRSILGELGNEVSVDMRIKPIVASFGGTFKGYFLKDVKGKVRVGLDIDDFGLAGRS